MRGNAALKLTTARYFTPKGRSIQAEGIKPDVELRSVRLTEVESEFKQLQERDLTGHLENGGEQEQDGIPTTTETDQKTKTDNIVETDYAVYEALNLLKALNIVANRR